MSHFVPNIDDNDVDFSREESVYIEQNSHTQKNSQPISTDELTGLPKHALSKHNMENGVKRNSSRLKCRKGKDSRWVAEQAIRMRERFHLSPNDELVASCSAALLKKILLQGRLYITNHHICFYTNLFGKVTKEAFSYISLAKVEKRRGGLVANVIKFYFADPDVSPIIIGSLNNREKLFSLIQERLKILNPAASEQNAKNGDRTSALLKDVSPVTSTRPKNSTFEEMSHDFMVTSTENEKILDALTETSDLQSKSAVGEDKGTSKSHTSILDEELKMKTEDRERSLVWCTEDDMVGVLFTESYQKRSERAQMLLNAPVKDVFNLLYISDWLKEYHQEVKNYDVDITEWQRDGSGRMCRDLRFRHPLAFKLGPKETEVNEKQWISYTDRGGVLIEVQGRNLDVPYSNYFVVDSFFEMSPINDGSDTLLVASVAVSFSKSTFLQGQIENGALSETKISYGRLVILAKERVHENLLQRAAIQNSKTSMQTDCQRVGSVTEPEKGTSDLSSQESAHDADEHENQNGVVVEDSATTFAGSWPAWSNEVATIRNSDHSLLRVDAVETVCDTSTKMERPDLVYYYLGTSLFVLVLTCILFAILLMRVKQLVSFLQKVVDTLEKEQNDNRC